MWKVVRMGWVEVLNESNEERGIKANLYELF